MTFFYDLNKKLDEIRATPSKTHGQLNERDMGKHNNATTGFAALAKKAGKEYGSKAAGERVAGAQFQKMKKSGKIEEEGMSRAAKGYEKYGKEGMQALAKAGREGKALDPVRNRYDKYDEGVGDVAKKVGSAVKKVGGAVLKKLGHGDDQAMRKDLQRKMGVPQTGKKPQQVKEKMSPARAQSFAALAPPKDKITFADKIAGAKKEVDEMLGDVAAEAIKGALSPKQKKIDMNKNGRLDANDFAMLRKGGKKQVADEGWDEMEKDVKSRMGARRVGDVTHGDKHDTQEIPGGRRVTRRVDPNTGYSVGADSDEPAAGEKRGRGRPKKSDAPRQERVTAKSRKTDRTAWSKKKTNEDDLGNVAGYYKETQDVKKLTNWLEKNAGLPKNSPLYFDDIDLVYGDKTIVPGALVNPKLTFNDLLTAVVQASKQGMSEGDLEITDRGEYDQEGEMAKDDIKTIVRHAQALEKVLGDNDNLPEWVQAKLAKIEGMMTAVDDYMQNQQDDEQSLDEKEITDEHWGMHAHWLRDQKKRKEDNRAEKAGKKVTKDIEYDEKKKDDIHGKRRGSEDAKAEKAGKKVAKDIEYSFADRLRNDEKKDKPKKVAKDIEYSFADRLRNDEKKKVKEQGGTDTPTASSGFSFGQGIYDSMNRELESMISESMNISMSMNTDAAGGPSKSITVTATDDDALKLGELLKNAGLGGGDHMPHVEGGADLDHPGAIEVNGTMDADGAEALADQIRQAMGDHDHAEGEVCDACGQEDCGCEEVDEAYGDDVVSQNSPDYPTNTETAQDSFEYSGGLNGPKSTGQTTIPVIAGQEERMGADDLHRLREMAGIREAKKPDFPDVDNDGNKKETIEKAVDDKKAAGDKKVAESLMAELQRFMKA